MMWFFRSSYSSVEFCQKLLMLRQNFYNFAIGKKWEKIYNMDKLSRERDRERNDVINGIKILWKGQVINI